MDGKQNAIVAWEWEKKKEGTGEVQYLGCQGRNGTRCSVGTADEISIAYRENEPNKDRGPQIRGRAARTMKEGNCLAVIQIFF